MIEITRSLARQLRSVFRRAARKGSGHPMVSFHADRDGLVARLHHSEILVEYRQPGTHPADSVVLPLDALADFEAKTDTVVSLESAKGKTVQAQWHEGVVPRVKEYGAGEPGKLSTYPDVPEKMTVCGPTFMKALADATASAGVDAVRYAVQNLQFRGSTGTLIATDGHQLLLQSGFQFPWDEEVLVPATSAFGCRELIQEGPVRIGKGAAHVTLQAGPWTLHLPIDAQGRFPKAEQVIPSLTGTITRLTIDPDDASFLAKTLPCLPADEANSPVTVDLNGEVLIRAQAGAQGRITEVLLARSQASDKAVRFRVQRNLLARALDLGFHQVNIVNADSPLLCQDEKRKLVVMSLGKGDALKSTDDAVRISSTHGEATKAAQPSERRKTTVKGSSEPKPASENGNGHAKPVADNGATHANSTGTVKEKTDRISFGSLIAEADALKAVLREAFNRSRQLITAIRKHKKQAHAVQATLAGLRQLQRIDG